MAGNQAQEEIEIIDAVEVWTSAEVEAKTAEHNKAYVGDHVPGSWFWMPGTDGHFYVAELTAYEPGDTGNEIRYKLIARILVGEVN